MKMLNVLLFFLEEDYIYWADSDHGTITRVKRDGSQRENIVGLPNHDSTQTDWLAGNLFIFLKGEIEIILD